MKKSIAFIFTYVPYGTVISREGLEMLLSATAFCAKIGVFFISDGVFILLSNQKSEKIFAKDFIAAFCLLPIYGIIDFCICFDSLKDRGLLNNKQWVLPVKEFISVNWRKKLSSYDLIITF